MKYKVGDIVKLRDDLENFRYYGEVNAGMINQIKENPFEIVEIVNRKYKNETDWVANDKMIEGLWGECKSSEQVSKSEGKSEGKYKLIDVLNKIANGELKEGTKVIYKGEEYTYRKDSCSPEEYDLYIEDRLITISDNCYLSNLNDEVELIEPNHFPDVGKMAEHLREYTKMIEPTDNTKIEELKGNGRNGNFYTIHDWIVTIEDKLNEVIRKINKEDNNE